MFPILVYDKYFSILIILSTLTLISSFMLILAINPIHSLLFLVLIFLLTTCTFLLFKIEYISMLFLIVYLGAIVVLFLFVVMMLNIRVISINEKIITYFPISFFVFFGFFLELLFTLNNNFIKNNNLLIGKDPTIQWERLPRHETKELIPFNFVIDYINMRMEAWYNSYPTMDDIEQFGFIQNFELISTLSNIHNIAIMLYTEEIHVFILGGIILLIGMIGAIVLTLQDSQKIRKQNLYSQNSKTIIRSIRKFK